MSTISPTRRSDPRAAATPAAIPLYAYDDIDTPAAAHTVATHPSPPCVPRHVTRNVAPHALYLPRPRHTRHAHPQSSARVVSPAVPVPHPLFTTAGYSVDRAAGRVAAADLLSPSFAGFAPPLVPGARRRGCATRRDDVRERHTDLAGPHLVPWSVADSTPVFDDRPRRECVDNARTAADSDAVRRGSRSADVRRSPAPWLARVHGLQHARRAECPRNLQAARDDRVWLAPTLLDAKADLEGVHL